MYKKLISLISFVFVLGLVSSPLSRAATRTWDNEGGDNRWDNPLNWSNNKIPAGSADHARIVLTGADECLIDSAVSADPKNVFVGYQGAAGDLRMTGGLLRGDNIYLGRESVGRFYLLDGTVNTANTVQIGDDIGGNGSLEMSGGTLNVGPDPIDPATTRAMQIGNDGGTGNVTMTGGIINVSGNLNVGIDTGADGVTGSNGLLDMLGGTINVGSVVGLSRDFRIGHNYATGAVNMAGGTINVSGDMRVGSTSMETISQVPLEQIPHPGTGTLTMSGGLISIADSNALKIGLEGSTGWVDLLGGIIMAGDLVIGASGSGMNITGGKLILNGDRAGTILDYVATGQIIGYGSPSGVVYDYDVTNAGKTTVTAIPEPATIVVLGFGGLVLLSRRRTY